MECVSPNQAFCVCNSYAACSDSIYSLCYSRSGSTGNICGAKNKGILLAKNIAQENLQAFIRWDFEGVKESIKRRIDEKLVYVIL